MSAYKISLHWSLISLTKFKLTKILILAAEIKRIDDEIWYKIWYFTQKENDNEKNELDWRLLNWKYELNDVADSDRSERRHCRAAVAFVHIILK